VTKLHHRVPHLLRQRPWLGDALVGLGIIGCYNLLRALSSPEIRAALEGASTAQLLGIVAGALPVALRRVYPWGAVAAVYAYLFILYSTSLALPGQYDYAAPMLLIGYSLPAQLPLWPAIAGTAALWGPLTAYRLLTMHSLLPSLAESAMYTLLLFLVGRTMYTRRAYAEAQRCRAEAAEASQETTTARAVAEERRRIAQELHDVVAHHISVMSILSSGARRTLTRDPKAADEALATIEETGRTVLREMRNLLQVLRQDHNQEDPLHPQPGISAIAGLVDQVRETGLEVNFTCEQHLDDLGPGLALTVYRIVQESLTNAIKHAGPATATVAIHYDGKIITIEVSDNGRGPQPGNTRPGHGLIGMRERVAVFGGTLRVGPRPGGGYRMVATIPSDPAGRLIP
jgi:signal transduction histidine kinase